MCSMSIDSRLQVQVGRDPAQPAAAGQPGQGRRGRDGSRDRRPARRGQLPAAARIAGAPEDPIGRESVSRPRSLRPLPAGLHVQNRHRHGRPAQGPAAGATRLTSACASRTAASAISSRAPTARSATTCRTRAARDGRYGARASSVSCNAYFAQLGTYDVGAEPLFETANLLGIATAAPNTAAQLKKSLPQSSYGQGQVVASPFQMARVAATVANGGTHAAGPLDHR